MRRNITILGTGAYFPENKVYNEFFVEHFNKLGMKSEGLMKHLGRRKRYLTSDGESSLSMAYEAAKRVLLKLKMLPEEIDMIVFISDTPEYMMPTNALKLVDLLSAENANVAFDMNANCTGMLTGVDLVSNYMRSKTNIKKALVVGAFHISSVVQQTDTVVYPNFADAASAVILEAVSEEESRGILDTDSFVDSSYNNYVTLPKCGMSRIHDPLVDPEDKKLEWNPFEFGFLSVQWAGLIQKILNRNRLTSEHIDYYIFSQLSDPDNLATLERLGVGEEKYYFLGKEYGYTGNTCPFLVLNRMWDVMAKKGKRVVFCSVGAGYSINAMLYEF